MAHPDWTDEFFDKKRRIGDEPADRIVSELYSGREVGAVNSMMHDLVKNDKISADRLPSSLREFLESEAVLPTWADPRKIRIGEQLFWLHGPAMVLILFCYSLPFTYAARNEAQVLWLTGRLFTHPGRRITETAQMLINVMAPNGLRPSGSGIRTAQKVRLMHAGVRHQIRASKEWKERETEFGDPLGDPLNQEDLAGTLMSFTWIMLDGLRKLGISVSETQGEAYLHCWKAVGHILGVHEDLLPDDLADAEVLTKAFERRQFGECDEGKGLTNSLMQLMTHILPGIFGPIPPSLTHFFVGENSAKLLGVKALPLDDVFVPLRTINGIADDIFGGSQQMQKRAEFISRHLLKSLELVARGGSRPKFSIPIRLRHGWKVDSESRINLFVLIKETIIAILEGFPWHRHA